MTGARRFRPIALLAFALAACGGGAAPVGGAAESASVQSQGVEQPAPGEGRMTEVHPGFGGSPHVRVEWMVDGANVSITYGRPYLKGRTVGETVEPMRGQVWRLGADQATTLSSDRPLVIGGTEVPAGDHTLWVLDTGETWQLIVNRQTGQMGTEYDPAQDLGRVPMMVSQAEAPTEQLTISIRDERLVIEWGRAVATVPLQVGDVAASAHEPDTLRDRLQPA